jgi:hypothetical protein
MTTELTFRMMTKNGMDVCPLGYPNLGMNMRVQDKCPEVQSINALGDLNTPVIRHCRQAETVVLVMNF